MPVIMNSSKEGREACPGMSEAAADTGGLVVGVLLLACVLLQVENTEPMVLSGRLCCVYEYVPDAMPALFLYASDMTVMPKVF